MLCLNEQIFVCLFSVSAGACVTTVCFDAYGPGLVWVASMIKMHINAPAGFCSSIPFGLPSIQTNSGDW